MNFFLKYKKYKQKYIDLKKQLGGGQNLKEARELLIIILSKYADKPELIKHLAKLLTILEMAISINDQGIPEDKKKEVLLDRLSTTGISLHNDSTSTSNFEMSIDNIAIAIFRLNEFINEKESNFKFFGIRFNEISFVCADAVIDEIYTIILNSDLLLDYGKPIIMNIVSKIRELIELICKTENYFYLFLPTFKEILQTDKSIMNYMKMILKSPEIAAKASTEIPSIIPLLTKKFTTEDELITMLFDYILKLELFEIVTIRDINFFNVCKLDEGKLLSQTVIIRNYYDYQKLIPIYIKFFAIHTIQYKNGTVKIKNITGIKVRFEQSNFKTFIVCLDEEIDLFLIDNIKFNN